MPWLAGYPREKIDWFPEIDYSQCVKCGMCMNCGRKVYNWTDAGPLVKHPYDCVPGCTTCAVLCMKDAISFPDRDYIRKIYKKNKVWLKVREALKKEGKLTIKKGGNNGN